MNGTAVLVFVIEVAALVLGQVLLKHALERGNQLGFRHSRVIALFAGGIAGLSVSFFLMLGLLQHFALSYFFPLQASSTLVIVLAAALFLRERLSLTLILGTLLICAGIVLVSTS
jgi:drug/metabolite transporter (DMT)-like permease